VISGLTLGVNLGGEHAYITSSTNSLTAAVGQDVLYTPEYTASVLANYGWRVTSAIEGFLRTDYEYTGKSFGSYVISTPTAPNPGYINPGYSVVNMSTGVNIDKFEIALFAKNLFDNKTILQSPLIDGEIQGYTLRPVTVGLSFQAKFR
jgi:iron complex outermembrane receptor protein